MTFMYISSMIRNILKSIYNSQRTREETKIHMVLILLFKFIYHYNKSCKKLNIHSIRYYVGCADIKDVLQKY